jgi:hypothetical protein
MAFLINGPDAPRGKEQHRQRHQNHDFPGLHRLSFSIPQVYMDAKTHRQARLRQPTKPSNWSHYRWQLVVSARQLLEFALPLMRTVAVDLLLAGYLKELL